jgi:beta-ribofuranosylaminobenzene 5'-phosphate synthase
MSMVIVTAFSRLHVGLIDLAGITSRRYGGAGFCLQSPVVRVSAKLADVSTLATPPTLSRRAVDDIKRAMAALSLLTPAAWRVEVLEAPMEHIGLGTKTALLLAVVTACAHAADLALSREQIQGLSGRGGTSGIGVNVFFTGGFVVDLGHPQTSENLFGPSSTGPPRSLPRLSVCLPIPQNWRFHLFLPGGLCYTTEGERAFFIQRAPIPPSEVLDVLASVYHSIVPAVAYDDFDLLRVGLSRIQQVGFKLREIRGQPHSVGGLIHRLEEMPDLAVGMSSMGPLVYAIRADPAELPDSLLQSLANENGADYLGSTVGRNEGHATVYE